MLKLKIITIGKTKEDWLDQALNEYIKRLRPILSIEFRIVKSNEQLLTSVQKENLCICLDPKGVKFTSEAFASYLETKFIEGKSQLSIVIGGAEGLPEELKKHPHLVSFSDMTMTHQLVRLMLIEQVYRAFEILKGSKYHK